MSDGGNGQASATATVMATAMATVMARARARRSVWAGGMDRDQAHTVGEGGWHGRVRAMAGG